MKLTKKHRMLCPWCHKPFKKFKREWVCEHGNITVIVMEYKVKKDRVEYRCSFIPTEAIK